MHLIVIDSSDDSVLAYDRQIHERNFVPAANVVEMVDGVLRKLGRQTLERLTIWGHGYPGVQIIGNGNNGSIDSSEGKYLFCDASGNLRNRTTLARLCGKFSWDGRVDLHGCNVGAQHSGRQLLRALAELWGVPVRAGVLSQYSHVNNRYDGPMVQAWPPAR